MSGTLRIMLLAVVLMVGVHRAPAQTATELSPQELSARLEQLREQVAQQQKALEASQQRWQQQLSQQQSQRDELAEHVLEAELHRQRQIAQIADAKRELAQVRDQNAELAKALAAAQAQAAQLAERLSIYMPEIPGSDATAVRELTRLLQNGSAVVAADARAARAAQLAQAFDALHAQAGSISVTRQTLALADGTVEEVDLLAVGHVAFAYRRDSGEMGLALASPADAQGFRWTQELSPENQKLLAAQFDAASGDVRWIPMDITQRLRVQMLAGQSDPWRLLKSGGPVMYPLLGVALIALLLLAERTWFLWRQRTPVGTLVPAVLRSVEQKEYDKAEQLCAKERGVAARTLAACLRRHKAGQHAMEDGIQEQLLHEMPRLQRCMALIAVLAALAPLLGLLGTVTGIMQVFGVIRLFGNANPGLMAGGISEALLTTAFGLIIAIPILLVHNVLSGRLELIVSDAEKHAATLLNQMAHQQDKPAAREEDSAKDRSQAHV